MEPTRRDVLAALGTGAAASLAGCAVGDDRPDLDLVVENYRDESLRLRVELLRPGVADRSAALTESETVQVPANAVGDELVGVRDVATARPYRVEATLGVDGRSVHYHYVPDCLGRGAAYDPLVYLRLRRGGGVTWAQTRCGEAVDASPV